MKNFIKDILIFLVLMTFLTMMFQSIGGSNSNSNENVISSNIDLIEGEIDSSNYVNDGYLDSNEKEEYSSGNIIAKLINIIAKIFTSAINLFIKLVMGFVQVFLG